MYLYFDGGSRGNPGLAGWGAVLYDDEMNRLESVSGDMTSTTNNVAEYRGLIDGLKKIKDYSLSTLHIRGDSNLVIRQIKREWKCKQSHLIPLRDEALSYINTINPSELSIQFIKRENNKDADALANEAMDKKTDDE